MAAEAAMARRSGSAAPRRSRYRPLHGGAADEGHGIMEVLCGGKKVITTNPDTAQPCPDDKVPSLVADMPNELWVSDFTHVSTWQGMVYVAFVTDVFARKIVGWRLDVDDDRLRARRTKPGHLPEGAVRG